MTLRSFPAALRSVHQFLPGVIAGFLLLCCTQIFASEMVVEGEAPLRDGNLAEAREVAIRNALAEAARAGSLQVETRSGVVSGLNGNTSPVEQSWERTTVHATARVQRHELIDQRVLGDVLRVRLRVFLSSAGSESPDSACRSGHLRRLLIGGFPLERPEQLLPDELDGYARLTARELARRIDRQQALLVDHNGSVMLQDGLPERVVGDLPANVQAWQKVRETAQKHRAQYLLIGLFRSLALSGGKDQRTLEVDALLIDGTSGSCVARSRFTRSASGQVALPKSMSFGSPAFYASDLGRAYGDLLDEVAGWAGAQASCLPFTARVFKVDGDAVYLDAGAEQSVAVGDSFAAFRVNAAPLTTLGGEFLGVEKRPAGELKVRHVYPRFSIGELSERKAGVGKLEVGDELHFH